MKDTAVTLKKIREQKKLTQTEVAEKLEISQSVYARIESGKIKLRFDHLQKFSELVGMSVTEIMAFPDIIDHEKSVFTEIDCEKLPTCEIFKKLKTENDILKIKLDYLQVTLVEKNVDIMFLKELLIKNNIKS